MIFRTYGIRITFKVFALEANNGVKRMLGFIETKCVRNAPNVFGKDCSFTYPSSVPVFKKTICDILSQKITLTLYLKRKKAKVYLTLEYNRN
jgi:hypothetical protein